MNRVRFLLTLHSPLGFVAGQAIFQERGFIPGSLVRGAIARAYLAAHGQDAAFGRIFATDANVFPFLSPALADGAPRRWAPRVWAACKRERESHGVRSLLRSLVDPPRAADLTCSTCGQDLKPLSGFPSVPVKGAGEPPPSVYSMTTNPHTAIDPGTRTAKPHAYYQEVILTPVAGLPVHFSGDGMLDDEALSCLGSLSAGTPSLSAGDSGHDAACVLLLGKSRSRGLGWAELRVERMPANTPKENAARRGRFLSCTFPQHPEYFTVTALSPWVLLDDWLRPLAKPDLWLTASARCRAVSVEAGTVAVTGWSMLHGLPKTEDVAVDVGSVFVYERPPGLSDEEFSTWCLRLEESGIGERRQEGYGQLRINDPCLVKPEDMLT